MSVYIALSHEGRRIIWGRNKTKKLEEEIYIYFTRKCRIFFLGRIYKEIYKWLPLGTEPGESF